MKSDSTRRDFLKTIGCCSRRKYKLITIAKRLGKLLGRNSRAAGLFQTDVVEDAEGRAKLVWEKVESWRSWAKLG